MKKIISLFKREYGTGPRLVYNELVEGAEWVVAGEGIATEKFDGTACMARDGKMYKRYDCKDGKTPPTGWEPCEDTPNEHTGHWPGWLPIGNEPDSCWHREALRVAENPSDGTYELVGPKVQGNPYGLKGHALWRHGCRVLKDVPTDFKGLCGYFMDYQIEGIVWHHPDGRMVKIKARDFDIRWPPSTPPGGKE